MMKEIEALIRTLRLNHLCITAKDDCDLCAAVDPVSCRRAQKLIKEAADMLTKYYHTGMTPQEIEELKFRMEGLDK